MQILFLRVHTHLSAQQDKGIEKSLSHESFHSHYSKRNLPRGKAQRLEYFIEDLKVLAAGRPDLICYTVFTLIYKTRIWGAYSGLE